MLPIIRLPRSVQRSLEGTSRALLQPPVGPSIDFARPPGEAALMPATSISWRIFKNPISLLVGGIAAVIMEFAEPAVRTGVWQHSRFLEDPLGRLRRTGLAAMVTVYGARSVALPMIQGVVRMHAAVIGRTPSGEEFCANDAQLLRWVHATASYGFGEAYSRYAAALNAAQFDALYAEGGPVSRLYGAAQVPRTGAEMHAYFDSMRGRLEPSDIVFRFIGIMRTTPGLPAPLHWLQPLLVRAAVDMVPGWMRERLGLGESHGLSPAQRNIVRIVGALADRIVLDGPAVQSCRRLGLAPRYLYE